MLELFALDLSDFVPKTVRKHVNNVDFYVNDYLLYEDPLTFDEGISKIGNFFGYYFIRKYMWSTPGTIKSTAASIRKFYKSMLAHGKISKQDYAHLCEIIKVGMPRWQADYAPFNNLEEDSLFDFF